MRQSVTHDDLKPLTDGSRLRISAASGISRKTYSPDGFNSVRCAPLVRQVEKKQANATRTYRPIPELPNGANGLRVV